MANSSLVDDPIIQQRGFNLPWRQWSPIIYRIRTNQRHCASCRKSEALQQSISGKRQAMLHVIISCSRIKLKIGLQRLHAANDAAVPCMAHRDPKLCARWPRWHHTCRSLQNGPLHLTANIFKTCEPAVQSIFRNAWSQEAGRPKKVVFRSTPPSPPNNIRGGKCPSVDTSLHAVHEKFFRFQWNLVRTYRSMTDARRCAVWPDPRSRSRSRGFWISESCSFQSLSPLPFTVGAGKLPLILKLPDRIFIFFLLFVSRELELGEVPPVSPSTKKFLFSDFNEIWYIDRGWWLMHDVYDAIQDQGQGHEWLKATREESTVRTNFFLVMANELLLLSYPPIRNKGLFKVILDCTSC